MTIQFAILFGYLSYVNEGDKRKTFIPRGIVYTTYSENSANKMLIKYRIENRSKPKDCQYVYKVVKADKYKAFLDRYNFDQWHKCLLEDISYNFKDLAECYRTALLRGIENIRFDKYMNSLNDLNEIMCLSIKDISYTTSAKETISATFRTSTWSFNVIGNLGKIPFWGTYSTVDRL